MTFILPKHNKWRNKEAMEIRRLRRLCYANEQEIKPYACRLSLCMAIALLMLIGGCLVSKSAHASNASIPIDTHIAGYSLDQWADAIRITEGVHSKYPYGIKSIHARNASEARTICKRTIWHKWQNYCALPTKIRLEQPFLGYLGNRYCPPSVDPVGNRRWKVNMNRILKEGV